MRDTTPEVQARYRQLFEAMTPGDRLAMGSRMHGSAKRTIAESIKRKHPNITPAQLRGQIFLAFYRTDFDEDELRRIESNVPELEFDLD